MLVIIFMRLSINDCQNWLSQDFYKRDSKKKKISTLIVLANERIELDMSGSYQI